MISKKLLSEVLNCEGSIQAIHFMSKNQTMVYYDEHTCCASIQREINIYELAHKCKEWAFDNFYMVRTNYEYTIDGKLSRVSMSKNCEFNESGNWFFSTCAVTEPEAIFKACDWILDKRLNS